MVKLEDFDVGNVIISVKGVVIVLVDVNVFFCIGNMVFLWI